MTHDPARDDLHLRAELMRHFADIRQAGEGGMRLEGPGAFSYACLTREKLVAARMEHPVLGIVLRGTKEVWLGETGYPMPAGTVFALPRGVGLDILNIPDARSGFYQSLLIEVSDLPQGVAPLSAEEARAPAAPGDFAIPLTADLVAAIGNARRELRDPAAKAEICRHRIAEVLLLLRRVPQARPLFWQSLPDRVRWLIRSDPVAPWSVEQVARQLGLGASTLRRRLVQEGQPFRAVLREARMEAARAALLQGESVGAAAGMAGYASRSHFARRFREAFGTTPAAFG